MNKTIENSRPINPQDNFITTTAFARLCGVSRFSVINWTKTNRIKTITTMGGHRRIPVSEVISYFEEIHLNNSRNDNFHKTIFHCWESDNNISNKSNCSNCVIYKRNVTNCFFLVKQLGKEAIGCNSNCLDCDYFNEFFKLSKIVTKEESPKTLDISNDTAAQSDEDEHEKKNKFLTNFGYGLGHNLKGIKKTFGGIKNKLIRAVPNNQT